MVAILHINSSAFIVLVASFLALLVDNTIAKVSSLAFTHMPFYLFRPQLSYVDQHLQFKSASDWSKILAASEVKQKRVHNLALLRFSNKLAKQNALLEGRLRDKRVHSLSLLRFNGRNPLAMFSKQQKEVGRSKRVSPTKRMHHLSLLRTNGKLFYNPSSNSSEQQKRFDVDRLRWQKLFTRRFQ